MPVVSSKIVTTVNWRAIIPAGSAARPPSKVKTAAQVNHRQFGYRGNIVVGKGEAQQTRFDILAGAQTLRIIGTISMLGTRNVKKYVLNLISVCLAFRSDVGTTCHTGAVERGFESK